MKQLKKFVPCFVACGGTELDAIDFIFTNKILKKFESLNIAFLKNELKEDEEVRKILEANKPVEEKKEEIAMSLYPSDSELYNTDGYVSPNFEEKKENEEVQEIKEEDEING